MSTSAGPMSAKWAILLVPFARSSVPSQEASFMYPLTCIGLSLSFFSVFLLVSRCYSVIEASRVTALVDRLGLVLHLPAELPFDRERDHCPGRPLPMPKHIDEGHARADPLCMRDMRNGHYCLLRL